MYNDLLGKRRIDEDEEEIKLKFKRSLIDDLYALHGMVGIKSFLQVSDEMLKKAVVSQILNNHKENKKYYKERAQNIFKKVMKEREMRERDNGDT